jgi:hypothetical protein
VRAYRYALPTYNNDTNNNVESVNSKIKHFVRKNSKIHACVQGIFKYIKFLEKKYQWNDYVNKYVDISKALLYMVFIKTIFSFK